jgi:capsular exopolysaccharide synthesis family protein
VSISSQGRIALLTDYDAGSAYSRAYYTLYTNIQFSWDCDRTPRHSLLFATPAAFPGYAAAAANVAIAAAQNGMPTILVDANVQAPSLQQRFGLDEGKGLSNLLKGETITPQALPALLGKTFIPGLSLLCAGTIDLPPQEASRLLNAKLKDILDNLHRYLAQTGDGAGLVIFNAPPVLAGTEASLIASLVEQTFLLVAAGATTSSDAQRAREQLERAHAKLAGIVMLDL